MKNKYLFYVSGREPILSSFASALSSELIALADDPIANHDSGLYGERILRCLLCDLAGDDNEALRVAFEAVSLCNGIVISCMPRLLAERPVDAGDLFGPEATPRPASIRLPNRYPALCITRAFNGSSPIVVPDLVDDDLGLWQDLFECAGHTLALNGSERCLASDLLGLATRDEGVYLLLKLFALEINWVSLYRILETLKSLMREDGFTSPISDKDETAFTNSANNFSITGLRSRHGLKRSKKPNMTNKASLNEGFETIRSAAEGYLRFKLVQASSVCP